MQEHHVSIGRYLSCLYRHTQMYLDRQLRDYGLGYGSLSFLMILFRNDGIHQEELSRILNIDKATTARAIGKLINAGYLRREPDIHDRRASFICLTPEGISLKPELERLSQQWTEQLTAGFSDEERAQVYRLLDKMSRNTVTFRTEHFYK
ncbi:MAG TPA: MarR family transcriptional regulator [Candidatus Marinimicrobia bacterium]|nr:MarR family transcriptional regulator [Candidatus Neomarinimicrobiota bacterium]